MNKLMNLINHGNTVGNAQSLRVQTWFGVLFLLHVQCGLTALLDHIFVVTIQKHWGGGHIWKTTDKRSA